MKKKEVLKEWNYKLNRLIEEKEYLEFDIAEDWLKRELKLNPYLQQNQKDVILFRERVYKDKFKNELIRVNKSIIAITEEILKIETEGVIQDHIPKIYNTPICNFKKVDDRYSGTVCFEIGLKVFNSIEDIEEYLKTNKGKVINMYDKSYIPDLFGNSLRITREQLDYAMTL